MTTQVSEKVEHGGKLGQAFRLWDEGKTQAEVKAVLKLKGLTYPRGRAFERNGTSLS